MAIDDGMFFFPSGKATCTKSFYNFLEDYDGIVSSVLFIAMMATSADEKRVRAHEFLLKYRKAMGEEGSEEEIDPSYYVKEFVKHDFAVCRSIICGFADVFLWYLVAIIQDCGRRRPEILNTNEKISIEDILVRGSKSEIIEFLLDRKINSLSYGGLKGIEAFANETLGISIFQDQESRDAARLLIECRNVYAHNRGFVNEIFIRRLEGSGLELPEIGSRLNFKIHKIIGLINLCVPALVQYDHSLAKKFKIQKKKINTWGSAFPRLSPV
ncbi:hypothetical protein [Vannielia litorea]|nr:hypothetical protein [Vannielia litorea]